MQQRLQLLLPSALVALSTLLLAGCSGPNLFDRFGNFWSYGICSAIVVILDVIALIEVLGDSGRSTGDKVLWGVVILFFPILGCILYYFMGRK